MNQLTTIASIPQAGGCQSHLPAEVGETNAVDELAEACLSWPELEPGPIDLGMVGE